MRIWRIGKKQRKNQVKRKIHRFPWRFPCFNCNRRPYARSTLPERRHLEQTYIWQGVPFTIAFTRFTFGFHVLFERLWEWETLIPKVTPFPQISHLAILLHLLTRACMQHCFRIAGYKLTYLFYQISRKKATPFLGFFWIFFLRSKYLSKNTIICEKRL